MTRFHEQLHRESSPDEQTLTLQMLSEEMQKCIAETLGIPKLPQKPDQPLKVCYGGQQWCKLQPRERVAFVKAPACCGVCKYFLWADPKEKPCEKCDFKRYYSEYAQEKCELKPKRLETVQAHFKLNRVSLNWTYELEKICKNRDFIIGYIDIYYKVNYKAIYDLEITPSSILEEFSTEEGTNDIIVECKPEIKTFQEVLRQVKTYASLMAERHPYTIIATYSEVPADIKKVLENQQVFIIQAPRQEKSKQKEVANS